MLFLCYCRLSHFRFCVWRCSGSLLCVTTGIVPVERFLAPFTSLGVFSPLHFLLYILLSGVVVLLLFSLDVITQWLNIILQIYTINYLVILELAHSWSLM